MQDIKDEIERPSAIEELVEVILDEAELEKKMLVGALLSKVDWEVLVSFLGKNKDMFAWTHQDMPKIDPSVACHRLNVDPEYPPEKQKQSRFIPERNKVISEEADRLMVVGSWFGVECYGGKD